MIFFQKAGTCATTLFVPINSKKKIPSVYTPYYSILVPYFNIRMVGRLWPTIMVTALITRLVAYPSLGVWKRQNKCLCGFNRCSGPHGSLWWLPGESEIIDQQLLKRHRRRRNQTEKDERKQTGAKINSTHAHKSTRSRVSWYDVMDTNWAEGRAPSR